MTIISTTVGKKPLEEMSSPHCQQKGPKYNSWVQSQKQQNDLSLFPKRAIQRHSNTSLCPNPQMVLAVKNPLANVGEAGYADSIPG